MVAFLQRPRTFLEIQAHTGLEAAPRLTALARLYLLAGARSTARLALQSEKAAFQPGKTLLWPEGRRPPQHGCVGTGTCCSASFLGPIHDRDAQRVNALSFGRQRVFAKGESPFETVQFRGKDVRGMARDDAGRCVVQADDGLCEIHLAHGLAAKPVTCRQFPLRFHASPEGIHVSLLLACDGYDRARPAAVPWETREAEIRGLLDEGAIAVPLHLPVTWSAGLPVPWSTWQVLRARFLVCEPETLAPFVWLDRVLELADDALATRAQTLAEGPEIAWPSELPILRAGLQTPRLLWPDDIRVHLTAHLRATADALTAGPRARDRQRLLQLADGLNALESALPLTDEATQHLNDIVTNDLQAQVVQGELDAGLGNLARRLLWARGVAAALAQQAKKAQIDARDTTQALHVVYRSEPELTWLGQHQAPPLQVAQA